MSVEDRFVTRSFGVGLNRDEKHFDRADRLVFESPRSLRERGAAFTAEEKREAEALLAFPRFEIFDLDEAETINAVPESNVECIADERPEVISRDFVEFHAHPSPLLYSPAPSKRVAAYRSLTNDCSFLILDYKILRSASVRPERSNI